MEDQAHPEFPGLNYLVKLDIGILKFPNVAAIKSIPNLSVVEKTGMQHRLNKSNLGARRYGP